MTPEIQALELERNRIAAEVHEHALERNRLHELIQELNAKWQLIDQEIIKVLQKRIAEGK